MELIYVMRKHKCQTVKFFSSDGDWERTVKYSIYKTDKNIKESYKHEDKNRKLGDLKEESGESVDKSDWKVKHFERGLRRERWSEVVPYADIDKSYIFSKVELFNKPKETQSDKFLVKKTLVKKSDDQKKKTDNRKKKTGVRKHPVKKSQKPD